MLGDLTRREFLTTTLVAPITAAIAKQNNPFTHPWIYQPSPAQVKFYHEAFRDMIIYGLPEWETDASIRHDYLGIRRD